MSTPVTYPSREWLRFNSVAKLRHKLGWTRRDFLALANHVHQKLELSKGEVASMLTTVKQMQKPPAPAYEGVVDDRQLGIGNFKMMDNGNLPEGDAHWDVVGAHLKFMPGTPSDVLVWALALQDLDPRQHWVQLLKRWKRITQLSGHELPDPLGYMDNLRGSLRAVKALVRAKKRDRELTTALPDSGDLMKRYWGLQVGDILPHPDGHQMEVVNVRINTGAPPTVTLRKVILPSG